jgi:hypothetical protein
MSVDLEGSSFPAEQKAIHQMAALRAHGKPLRAIAEAMRAQAIGSAMKA